MKFCLFSPQSYFMKQQLDRQFVMNKAGVYFELNEHDCIKIALNSANLPIALATNAVDITCDNLALYSCATDSSNVKLLAKAKRLIQWNYRLENCNFRLVRWMARKGYLKREVDQSSKILCDDCRIARGAQRPVQNDVQKDEAKLKTKAKKR